MYFNNAETGGTVSKAINTLKEHGVRVEKIILVTLFATPQGTVTIICLYHVYAVANDWFCEGLTWPTNCMEGEKNN